MKIKTPSKQTVRILFVEDEPSHIQLIREAFQSHGDKFVTDFADSLEKVRDYLSETTPDMVVAKYELTGDKGLEFLITQDKGRLFPVLVTANKDDNRVEAKVLEAGALDYIVKSPEALAAMPRIAERNFSKWNFMNERILAEKAIRLVENRYKSLTDNLNVGVYRITGGPEGRVIEGNPAFLEMFGYESKKEILNVGIFEFFLNPEDREKIDEKIREKGFIRDVDLQLRKKDGAPFIGSVSAVAVKDEGGKIKYVDGIIEDITRYRQVELELIKVKMRLKHLLTASPAVIYSCRPSGDYGATFISENVKAQMGYNPNEFTDNPEFWSKHIHPEDAPRVFGGLSTIFEQGYHSHEYRFLHKDGTYKWIRDGLRLVHDSGGNPVEIVGYWIDITDQKLAEEKIQQQNAFLRNVIDSLSQPFYVIDANDYSIRLANKAASEHNISEGTTCYAITHKRSTPCSEEEHPCPLEEVKKTKRPVKMEHIHYVDGNPRVFEVHGDPVLDSKGDVIRLIEYTSDITEHKRAEAALRESEEKYRILFESSRDASYITAREGNIIEANPSLLDLFGYSREEISDWKVQDTYVNPDDRSRFRKEIEENGSVKDLEAKLRKKDGTEMDCLITATVRRSNEGSIVGYQGIIRDVTELKRAREKRERLISELQEALAKVKTLSGLLPICASCKKIRDDKGYWRQIESYIHEHSEADFSHGICPDCARKLYPEYYEEDK